MCKLSKKCGPNFQDFKFKKHSIWAFKIDFQNEDSKFFNFQNLNHKDFELPKFLESLYKEKRQTDMGPTHERERHTYVGPHGKRVYEYPLMDFYSNKLYIVH
jgi:hypothetical protein